jgi:hypothetical protein
MHLREMGDVYPVNSLRWALAGTRRQESTKQLNPLLAVDSAGLCCSPKAYPSPNRFSFSHSGLQQPNDQVHRRGAAAMDDR